MSDEAFVSELFNGDYWMTPDELAEWLKLKKDWIYDSVQQNQIPYHRFGRQLRFRHQEVQAWLDDRRPANSIVTITIEVPGRGVVARQVDLRDLLGELMIPQFGSGNTPPPADEVPAPPSTMPVDEAGMEDKA